jgi:hypothetical protein
MNDRQIKPSYLHVIISSNPLLYSDTDVDFSMD